MKKILALLIISISITATVGAEEIVWEDEAVAEETYAECVFEEDQPISENQVVGEPEDVFEDTEIVENITDEETVFDEVSFDENSEEQEETVDESVFEELYVTEEVVSDESTVAASSPQGNEGLVYTGEPQDLIDYQEGWLYSLDGETYTSEIPTGINAGTYTVYMKEDKEENEEAIPISITVTIAKADVIFTPPMANTSA